MENGTRTLTEPVKLRANRKVVEGRCGICGSGFQLAEEAYGCPFCSGYHHAICWETRRACPTLSGNGVTAPEASAQVETALPVPSSAPEPAARAELLPDERRCPSCVEVIKSAAMKCRFCGSVLDRDLAAQQAATNIPPELAKKAASDANLSLILAIVGIFFCGPIVQWSAISHGRSALRVLDDYPSYVPQTAVRGKARAGVIIGWCYYGLFVLGLLAQAN